MYCCVTPTVCTVFTQNENHEKIKQNVNISGLNLCSMFPYFYIINMQYIYIFKNYLGKYFEIREIPKTILKAISDINQNSIAKKKLLGQGCRKGKMYPTK